MFDVANKLAVQSWCLRNFKDNKKVISLVKEIGLSRIELCGVHCDFNNPDTFDEVIGTYTAGGVKIVSIGVESAGADEGALRKRMDFAKKAGCKTISVHFSPATFITSLPICYKLFDEYGINISIHNHGGYHWLGNAEILDWIFSITRPCIGLNMDTAWALDARQDPIKWAQKYGKRLYATHIKDFVFDRAGKSSDVVVGTGNLDLPKYLAALKEVNFTGEAILEYEGDVENPIPALKECVEKIKHAG